jgi:dTDP-4-amino-4,6-dideoxygalactose transaminase
MTIRFYDLKSENEEFIQDFQAALKPIVQSGCYVLGPELARFEQSLATWLGVNRVYGTKSGSDALFYGLSALNIGPGDEVITSPFTFPATIEAILRTGATPVLADIDPETLCLSPELCAAAITGRTRALLPVHLFGNCADLNRLTGLAQQHNLLLIEDAAQALGAEYQGKKLGSFGAAAAFSFYPTKNLGALGNGGALVIDRPVEIPNSARLDELQAAFLNIKLPHLDRNLNRRREIAEAYRTALGTRVRVVSSASGSLASYHQFAILVPERDRFRQHLADAGIQTMVYYPEPIHHQARFARRFGRIHLPVAERVAREIVCLPIRQNLTREEIQFIISKVLEFLVG